MLVCGCFNYFVLLCCFGLVRFDFLKIILKERQERMQQRLQESAMSQTVASGDSQGVESGASNQTPSQDDHTGTSSLSVRACVRVPEVIFQVRATVRMVSCGGNCADSPTPHGPCGKIQVSMAI